MLTAKWTSYKKPGPSADIISVAKLGDRTALLALSNQHHCKVYTQEELKIVNFLFQRKRMEEDSTQEKNFIDTRSLKVIIEIPDFNGNLHPCQINWLEDLGGDTFLAGLEHTEGYPWAGAMSVYVLKKDPQVGFRPLFDAGWCLDESTTPPEKEVV